MIEFPEKDLNLFLACNGAQNWSHKPRFYNLKTTILNKHGSFDEYDIQFLKKKCTTCNGTGVFIHYNSKESEECHHCNKGIYSEHKIALKRFLLNEYVFHIPVGKVLENGDIELFSYNENKDTLKLREHRIVYRNNIQGLVVHKPSVPNIHFTFAFFVLCYKYDKSQFYFELENFSSALHSKQKGNYRSALRNNDLMMDGLAEFLTISDKEQYNIDDILFKSKDENKTQE